MAETLETRALKMLVARIEEETTRRVLALGDGAASSMDDYRFRVGFLQAFKIVRQLCEEVEAELYGGER